MFDIRGVFDSDWFFWGGYFMRDIMQTSPRAEEYLRRLNPAAYDGTMHFLFHDINIQAYDLLPSDDDYGYIVMKQVVGEQQFRLDFVVERESGLDIQFIDGCAQPVSSLLRTVTVLVPDESELFAQMLNSRWGPDELCLN